MGQAGRESKTTADGLECHVGKHLGGGITLSKCTRHDNFRSSIHQCQDPVVGLGQWANKIHAPMRKRLNRYAGEGINPQSQAIGTLGCITRTTTANEMANVSEKIRPPKNLNNVSFCTRDPRMPYKCPLMSRVEYRVARRLGHAYT